MEAERERFNRQLTTVEASRAPQQKLIHVFQEVSMRKGHPGLTELAMKQKLDPQRLKLGEYIVFINRPLTALKLFATGNTVAHFKMPDGAGRLDMRTIAMIPRFFNGKQIDYHGAVKAIIEKTLKKQA